MTDEDKHTLVIQPIYDDFYKGYFKPYSHAMSKGYTSLDYLIDRLGTLKDVTRLHGLSHTLYTGGLSYDEVFDIIEKEIIFRKLQL
jgi:hypothetical protein